MLFSNTYPSNPSPRENFSFFTVSTLMWLADLWLSRYRTTLWISSLRAYLFIANMKVSKIYIIPPHWHDTGSWNTSSRKTKTYIFYKFNILGTDFLAPCVLASSRHEQPLYLLCCTGIIRSPHVKGSLINTNLAKFILPITYFAVAQSFGNSAQYHCRALCKISKCFGNWNGCYGWRIFRVIWGWDKFRGVYYMITARHPVDPFINTVQLQAQHG